MTNAFAGYTEPGAPNRKMAVDRRTRGADNVDLQQVVLYDGTSENAAAVSAGGALSTTATINGTVTVDTELPSAVALSDTLGNPTSPLVGGANLAYDGTNWVRWKTATSAAGTTGTGVAGVGVLGFDGTNYQRVKTDTSGDIVVVGVGPAGFDGVGATTAFQVTPDTFNGTGWDRLRGNVDATALTSTARTATTSSADITAHNATGVAVFWDVTVVGASPSLTMSLEMKDPTTGKYKAFFTSTAVTVTGSYVYGSFPGNSTAGAQAGASTMGVPRTFRITITHTNTNSMTYSVGYSLMV